MATNKLLVKVTAVKSSGDLNILELYTKSGLNLALVCLDSNIKVGDDIEVGVNPTNVFVGLSGDNLSVSNKILVEIKSIEKGEILTKILGEFEGITLSSIITTNSANRLKLEIGENVYFLVKSTDMFVV
ncbi:MAG: TOBE domain-containing protein [Campylobacter sp.]|nr:TOBE domain-containing protein [Campylobacter sp.]